MRKKYVWSKENGKFMRQAKDGTLIDEPQTKEDMESFKDKVKTLSFWKTESQRSSDGFKPHYSGTLGKFISTRGQLEKECKEQGYSIAGTDKPPQHKEQETKMFDDNDIKELVQSEGVSISDNEAKALKEL